MSEEKPPMPDLPKTVEIAVPSPVEIAIAKLTAAMNANHEVVMHQLALSQARTGALEAWRAEQEARSARASDGVRGLSQSDASQDAKLAQALLDLAEEKRLREDLQKNAATKKDLEVVTKGQTSDMATLVREAASSSLGKKILAAAGVTILLALGSANLWLTSKAHHETQATPVFVPVLVTADGGVLPR